MSRQRRRGRFCAARLLPLLANGVLQIATYASPERRLADEAGWTQTAIVTTPLKPPLVRVTVDHRRSYDTPIAAFQGDWVRLGRADPDAPGWTWYEHPENGRAGWMPNALLAPDERGGAVLRRDYSAIELTVYAGNEVRAVEAIAGWTWCERPGSDAGWLPDGKLEYLD